MTLALPPLPDRPDVAVVVPARDAAGSLAAAVASALDQDVPAGLEVVVAAADEPTAEVARRLAAADPRVTVVDNPAGTTPAGLNRAVAASRGEVVVRLDAHAELPPGYIARAVDLLCTTGAANVGGRQVPAAGGGVAGAIAAAMASPVGSGGARYRVGGPPGEVDTVYLGVFRRAALDAVGGFDETLVRNQDYELNHRLRAAGGRVYFHPDLAVRYTPRLTLTELARQYWGYGAWKRAVLGRHPRSARPRQLAAPALVLALLAGVALWAGLGVGLPLVAVLVVYGAVLLGGGWQAARRAGRPVPLAVVVAALAVMHVAWGLSFLVGRAERLRPPRRAATMGHDRQPQRPRER